MRMILLCFLLALGSAVHSETLQHGNIVYTLPENWRTGRVEDGIQTLSYDPPDDVCEYCYIYLGKGQAKSGSLIDFVHENALAFVDEDERDGAEVMQEPELSQLGTMTVAMMGLQADDDLFLVFGYELTDRFEIVAFEAYGGYEGEDIEASFATFQEKVFPMFTSLQFVSEGAASLMPEPVPGDLQGIWWGWHQGTSMGIDGMMRIDVNQRRLVFWTDGYFYDGTPPNGLQPLNAATLTAAGDASFGTYVAKRGKIQLTFANGLVEELQITGSGLNDGDNELSQVEPLPDGTVLNGGVSSFFYSGFTPGAGVEGGVTSSSSTTFFSDGTYTGQSFGGAFGNFVDGGGSLTGGFATGGDGNTTGGRYEVKDGLLIQYPSDGSPPSASLVFQTDSGLLIDEQFFEEN
jgi:hypothetical protein